MAWKGEESEGVVAMSSADIKWAQWLRVARNFQLRVGLKDRRRETFDGFAREVSVDYTYAFLWQNLIFQKRITISYPAS
jgi:hypothetical protein